MNFKKRLFPSAWQSLLLCTAIIGLLAACTLPARAQVTPTRVLQFSNAPVLLSLGDNGTTVVSNATVNADTFRSNAVPVRPGKDLSLAYEFTQASNAHSATVTHYFGLLYNRTNTVTITNFSWSHTTVPVGITVTTAVRQRWYTNIPSAVLGNADGVFWWSTQSLATNSLTNCVMFGILQN